MELSVLMAAKMSMLFFCVVTPYGLKVHTDVSEEYGDPIFRAPEL
jgi:hypothetical protein